MLLDTHALLWVLHGDSRLSKEARQRYEQAGTIYYSAVNLWEIGIKLGLRRDDFRLDMNWWRDIPQSMRIQGVECLSIEPEDCREVGLLPLHHRDPFDRMLVVQALRVKCPILSKDTALDAYQVARIW
ncbi:MAG: type II toxin-antitoxin system VapC family toxin [Oceanipulchritudo sp.]